MAGVVVPYRGPDAKSRLPFTAAERAQLGLAMLADVLAAAAAVGPTVVVTSDPAAAALAPEVVPDPGAGQGAAVAAGLERLVAGPMLVVNADLPQATPQDLLALLGEMPPGGIALVEARDGTTNALALSSADRFAPVYGRGSAERFREWAAHRGVPFIAAPIANLVHDVDTLADLDRFDDAEGPIGRHTHAALAALRSGAAS